MPASSRNAVNSPKVAPSSCWKLDIDPELSTTMSTSTAAGGSW